MAKNKRQTPLFELLQGSNQESSNLQVPLSWRKRSESDKNKPKAEKDKQTQAKPPKEKKSFLGWLKQDRQAPATPTGSAAATPPAAQQRAEHTTPPVQAEPQQNKSATTHDQAQSSTLTSDTPDAPATTTPDQIPPDNAAPETPPTAPLAEPDDKPAETTAAPDSSKETYVIYNKEDNEDATKDVATEPEPPVDTESQQPPSQPAANTAPVAAGTDSDSKPPHSEKTVTQARPWGPSAGTGSGTSSTSTARAHSSKDWNITDAVRQAATASWTNERLILSLNSTGIIAASVLIIALILVMYSLGQRSAMIDPTQYQQVDLNTLKQNMDAGQADYSADTDGQVPAPTPQGASSPSARTNSPAQPTPNVLQAGGAGSSAGQSPTDGAPVLPDDGIKRNFLLIQNFRNKELAREAHEWLTEQNIRTWMRPAKSGGERVELLSWQAFPVSQQNERSSAAEQFRSRMRELGEQYGKLPTSRGYDFKDCYWSR